jgi:hypothetical protein
VTETLEPDPRRTPGGERGVRLGLLVAWLIVLASVASVLALGPLPQHVRILVPALLVGGLAWWLAVELSVDARLRLSTLLASALLLRVVALLASPGLSDDIHRYVWEAEVIARGWSPYAFAPAADELGSLRAELPTLFASLNNPEVPAAYPPLYQGAASAVVAVARALGGSEQAFVARALLLLRAFAAACDLGVLVALVALLRALRRPASLAIVWAWSPLATLEFAGAGHMDVLGILLWTSALALLVPAARGAGRAAPGERPRAGLVLLAGAILVKYLPVLSLPFALRGPRRAALRDGLLVVVLLALAFTPLLGLRGGTDGLLGGLSQYGLRWESTSLVYRFVEPPLAEVLERDGSLTDPRRLGRALVAAAWLATGLWLWLRRVDLLRASWTLLAAFLVLTPTLHPWYVAWALPFLAFRPGRAWFWLAAVSPLCYWMLERWWSQGVWQEPAWLWPVLAVPFFALLILDARRSRA